MVSSWPRKDQHPSWERGMSGVCADRRFTCDVGKTDRICCRPAPHLSRVWPWFRRHIFIARSVDWEEEAITVRPERLCSCSIVWRSVTPPCLSFLLYSGFRQCTWKHFRRRKCESLRRRWRPQTPCSSRVPLSFGRCTAAWIRTSLLTILSPSLSVLMVRGISVATPRCTELLLSSRSCGGLCDVVVVLPQLQLEADQSRWWRCCIRWVVRGIPKRLLHQLPRQLKRDGGWGSETFVESFVAPTRACLHGIVGRRRRQGIQCGRCTPTLWAGCNHQQGGVPQPWPQADGHCVVEGGKVCQAWWAWGGTTDEGESTQNAHMRQVLVLLPACSSQRWGASRTRWPHPPTARPRCRQSHDARVHSDERHKPPTTHAEGKER